MHRAQIVLSNPIGNPHHLVNHAPKVARSGCVALTHVVIMRRRAVLRDREQFEHWLDEWKDHTWSRRSPQEWSRVQLAESDVHEHTREVLAAPAANGLDRLTTVVQVATVQRDNHNRCRTRIGSELLALQEAGGAWQEIADWTNMDERTVRTLARPSKSRESTAPSPIDEDLAALVAQVPNNPFFRVCELLAMSWFFENLANELEDVTDWLCFELSTVGIDRSYIARHAHMNQLTVARRINRAKRRGWPPRSQRSTS